MLVDRHPCSELDQPGRVVPSSQPGNGGAVLLSHPRQWPWDRPATTLQADERIAPPGHHDESFLSGPNAIVLSERAAMRLQGFPDGWTIVGATKKSRWGQIGMAVPPALAEAVAHGVTRLLAASTASEVA